MFGDNSKRAINNFYLYYSHISQLSQFSSKVQEVVSLFAFFDFHSVIRPDSKAQYTANLFFNYHYYYYYDTVFFTAWIRWSVCISKSQRIFCISFSRMNSDLCRYHFAVWPNFNLLQNSQWMTYPTQSCLGFYFFCTSLLHLLTISLVSFSPRGFAISSRIISFPFNIVSFCDVILCCY